MRTTRDATKGKLIKPFSRDRIKFSDTNEKQFYDDVQENCFETRVEKIFIREIESLEDRIQQNVAARVLTGDQAGRKYFTSDGRNIRGAKAIPHHPYTRVHNRPTTLD